MAKLKRLLEKDLDIANYVVKELRDIIDNNSKWEAKIYITNLKKSSILLENKALLFVKNNGNHVQFQTEEDCILAIQKDGEEDKIKVDAPLIIHGEDCVCCYFITKNAQNQMPNGQGFREHFVRKDNNTYGWLELTIEGAGFIKRKKYHTQMYIYYG